MDELVHHCLRELSFDGDLGCNVSRLNDFVVEFYSQSSRAIPQNSDDRFCSFVWSVVVQHPTVLVGLLPEGVTSEVWVAPQTSAKRKAKASGEEHIETTPSKLDSITNAKATPLDELVRLYGERLRIAADPDAIFAAITGSHIRSSRMSPMVYTALQIITRGRDEGVTVVELGQKSKYDQKTCFYLVRQLTEMDLVVKVRRGGVGTHFCIHKYFYDRSPSWAAIRQEETQAEDNSIGVDVSVEIDEEDEISKPPSLHFTPIDSRHLSSLPLVKARVVKLLKASKNHIHASNNMLITLGFSNPTKTDRRFFQSRIRELIQQGVIEKVIVPSSRRKANGSSVKCFRLISDGIGDTNIDGTILIQSDDGKEDDLLGDDGGVKLNITIHKQIIDLLEETGTTGMTLNELSSALGNFDKRTIELLLTRAEKSQPPSHLADLGIAGLMETSGRERRHRYYTVAAYQKLVVAEQLDKSSAGFGDLVVEDAGGFSAQPIEIFYETIADLRHFQDTFSRPVKVGKGSGRQYKNPILSDGTVKQGRPRKTRPQVATETTKDGKKRKRAAAGGSDTEEVPTDEGPRKKQRRSAQNTNPGTDSVQVSTSVESARLPRQSRKTSTIQRSPEAEDLQTKESVSQVVRLPESQPKKRGRPPKRKAEPVINAEKRHAKRSRPQGHDANEKEPSEAPAITTSSPSEVVEDLTQPGHSSNDIAPPLPSNPVEEDGHTDELSVRIIVPESPRLQTLSALPDPPSQQTRNGTSGAARSRVNVSHLRRENELFRVIEESGGIVNIQTKEFYEAHMALIEVLTQAGEPTSAPVGTRTDKRTAVLTIDSLERKGKVKQLKTSVPTHTGVNKPSTVVYLPHINQEQLNAFLAELARGPQPALAPAGSAVKINEPVEYGADPSVSSRGILPLQLLQLEQPGDNKKERWSRNVARANQLFAYDDAIIREVLLAERTTLGQLYGFLVGKAARARQFYISTLRAFESDHPLLNIIPGSRIVELSHFCNDIPVGLYTALVSALLHSDQLSALFATEEGRNTPVKDLPSDLHTMLQVGRSRARSRILDILEFLRALNLVVPLKASISDTPWITCAAHENHPTAFDLSSDDAWTSSTPHAAPTYWYFKTEAPIYLWNASEAEPPFWKNMSVANVPAAQEFWDVLRAACIDPYLPHGVAGIAPVGAPIVNVGVARSIRRLVSWKEGYILTWHQMKFLEKSIDVPSGTTVLEEEDEAIRSAKLERLCWVTTAPQKAVEDYLRSARLRMLTDKDKIRGKNKEHKRLRRLAESRVSLAKKAEESRSNREKEWTSLLSRIHPDDLGPAIGRVERVHIRFMQAGSTRDIAKWEKEVLDAIREAELASKKVLQVSARRPPVGRPARQSTVPGNEGIISTSISVRALIEQQQPLMAQGVYKRKNKTKKSGEPASLETEKKSGRRHRFQWNKDYDELARDASVIIRARCRTLTRLDWAALEQVFPAVPRNTVRQRLSNIKETPGNESYLRRLEERWCDLWMQHRGTPALPDNAPESPSDFDLIQHIEFLRSHVDKNALRVGFGQEKEAMTSIIPEDVAQLLHEYAVIEELPTAPTWDFVWNAAVEEGREKRLLSHAFTSCIDGLPQCKPQESDGIVLAEAALKMVMGSPPESYNCDAASTLLRNVGEDAVSTATQNLLGRGVLSKSQRDPQKQKPGRQLKISDSNQNAMGGTIPRDTYQDAIALCESVQVAEDNWREWPLTATDGDAVALIHLVSEDQVEFKIDTSEARAARQLLDWNSKRADDDQIETAIFAKYTMTSGNQEMSVVWNGSASNGGQTEPTDIPEVSPLSPSHGLIATAGAACCRSASEHGVVDCIRCLEESRSSLDAQLNDEEKGILAAILPMVRDRGGDGCCKDSLKALNLKQELLVATLQKIADADVPLLYWVGYTSVVLVAAEYITEWTVIVSEEPLSRVFPRRWLNIDGMKIPDFWQAALRAMCALVTYKPGISQAEIRWRLRSVYDRQEVIEVLSYLQMEGYLSLRRRCSTETAWDISSLPVDDTEERTVFWFIGDKCWYQV